MGIVVGCAVALAWGLVAGGCARDAPDGVVAPETVATATGVVSEATAEVARVGEVGAQGAPAPAVVATTAPAIALATKTPASVPASAPGPIPLGPAGEAAAAWEEPPARDLFGAAIGFGAHDGEAPERTVAGDPDCCEVGHRQGFFVTDLGSREVYEVEAVLRLVSENAYWYVDEGVEVAEGDLREAAGEFEGRIRPAIVGAIGDVWRPGVDGDPRLTVLHTPLDAAAGYFGASDEFPRATHPYSNQREMIYMGLPPGSAAYLGVLAHEFQHAVHWHLDEGEDAWVNEGMSEIAAFIAGGSLDFTGAFLRRPEVQLNYWPDEPYATAAHYGAAALFVGYVAQRCGGYGGLGELARERADGVNGVNRYLSRCGLAFEDVFADWVVANYLDAPQDEHRGIYGYADHDVRVNRVTRVVGDFDETRSQAQLSARYYEIELAEGAAVVEFEGEAVVAQTGADGCRSGRFCWWSGAGDSVHTYLEREFDLSGLAEATLEFWMWADIEEDWDYGYVSVSTDGGATRMLLDGRHTTRANPLGNNFGAGVTGDSGGWAAERMDLTRYAGEASVVVRFEYVTDEGVNLDGWLIDDVSIPELGFVDDGERVDGWRAGGFRHTDNTLAQGYVVQVVEVGMDGKAVVRRMGLADDGGALRGSMRVEGFGAGVERAVVVVSPVAHGTYRAAGYGVGVRVE